MMMIPRKRNEFDLFRDFFEGDDFFPIRRESAIMKTDIKEKKDKYIIEMDLPGYEKENINLSLKDGYLEVTAEVNKEDENEEKDKFVHKERYYGHCSRSFYVGEQIKEEDNVKNINYSSVIEALNIKNRIKRINYIYDKACSEIDEYNKIKHIDCEFKNGKCMNQHNTKRINGCCRLCRLQSSHGCTSQNITCKLFFCDQLEKKYKTIKFNDIKILKCLSLTNRIIVKDNYFETKENFLRTLYLNSIIVFSIKVVINIIKNGVYLHKIRKNITKENGG